MTGPDSRVDPHRVGIDRFIAATPASVFRAWTDPAQLRAWWGPTDVECIHAEIQLRVGGTYRLANRMPSGETIWITGTFELVEPPTRLRYTWRREPATPTRRAA